MNIPKILGLQAPRSSFRNNQQTALTNLQGMRQGYGTMTGSAQSGYSQFSPQARQTTQNVLDYYNAGPDPNAALKKAMLGGIETGFNRAGAIARTAATRTGSDPAAAQASLAAKRAMAISSALTGYNQQQRGERERFLNAAQGVAGGAERQYLGDTYRGMGAQQGLEGDIYSRAGDLAQADEARANQTRQNVMGAIQMAASLAGGGIGIPRMPQAQTLDDGRGIALPALTPDMSVTPSVQGGYYSPVAQDYGGFVPSPSVTPYGSSGMTANRLAQMLQARGMR